MVTISHFQSFLGGEGNLFHAAPWRKIRRFAVRLFSTCDPIWKPQWCEDQSTGLRHVATCCDMLRPWNLDCQPHQMWVRTQELRIEGRALACTCRNFLACTFRIWLACTFRYLWTYTSTCLFILTYTSTCPIFVPTPPHPTPPLVQRVCVLVFVCHSWFASARER